MSATDKKPIHKLKPGGTRVGTRDSVDRAESAIELVETCRNVDTGEYEVVVRFRKTNGRTGRARFPRSDLLKPNRALERLVDRGLRVVEIDERELLASIRGMLKEEEKPVVLTTSFPGWHDRTFVHPQWCKGPHRIKLLPSADRPPCPYGGKTGRFGDAFASLEVVMKASDLAVFAVCVGLAAALLVKAALSESVVVHFFGQTSTGKTTLLRLIRALFGHDNGSLPTWDVTSRGLDECAASCRDLPFLVDDSSAAKTEKDRQSLTRQLVYSTTGGRGRHRSMSVARTGALENVRLRTIIVSSGEGPLVLDETRGGLSGDTVRVINIPVYPGKLLRKRAPEGAYDALVRAIKVGQGAIGKRWVEALIEKKGDKVERSLKRRIEAFVEEVAPNGSTAEKRLARKIGLFAAAGSLARRYQVVPFDKAHVKKVCARLYRAAAKALIYEEQAAARALARLAKAVRDLQGSPASADDEAFLRTKGKQLACFSPTRFEEVSGLSLKGRAYQELVTKGVVQPGQGTTPTRQKMHAGTRRRCIVIDVAVLAVHVAAA